VIIQQPIVETAKASIEKIKRFLSLFIQISYKTAYTFDLIIFASRNQQKQIAVDQKKKRLDDKQIKISMPGCFT